MHIGTIQTFDKHVLSKTVHSVLKDEQNLIRQKEEWSVPVMKSKGTETGTGVLLSTDKHLRLNSSQEQWYPPTGGVIDRQTPKCWENGFIQKAKLSPGKDAGRESTG